MNDYMIDGNELRRDLEWLVTKYRNGTDEEKSVSIIMLVALGSISDGSLPELRSQAEGHAQSRMGRDNAWGGGIDMERDDDQ